MIASASAAAVLASLPGPPTSNWPRGEPYAVAFKHGTMSVGIYAPVGMDPQTPHDQDEVYIVRSGTGTFFADGKRVPAPEGTALFVPAGVEHRFERCSTDFTTWVVFWGRAGGEPDP
jgi:hypothetical protein